MYLGMRKKSKLKIPIKKIGPHLISFLIIRDSSEYSQKLGNKNSRHKQNKNYNEKK